MKPGTRVRMSTRLKANLVANDCSAHVLEFGSDVGVVEGPVAYGGSGREVYGPEVNVRWSNGLRYGYKPEDLDVVD